MGSMDGRIRELYEATGDDGQVKHTVDEIAKLTGRHQTNVLRVARKLGLTRRANTKLPVKRKTQATTNKKPQPHAATKDALEGAIAAYQERDGDEWRYTIGAIENRFSISHKRFLAVMKGLGLALRGGTRPIAVATSTPPEPPTQPAAISAHEKKLDQAIAAYLEKDPSSGRWKYTTVDVEKKFDVAHGAWLKRARARGIPSRDPSKSIPRGKSKPTAGGRPSAATIDAALVDYQEKEGGEYRYSMEEISAKHNVSDATIYRHLRLRGAPRRNGDSAEALTRTPDGDLVRSIKITIRPDGAFTINDTYDTSIIKVEIDRVKNECRIIRAHTEVINLNNGG